jgi:GNAT superfamily N-acetyltransferase
VLAFTGAITRGTVTFLTDLFVHPAYHSSQLGKTLLSSVLPQDELAHCTVSSSDLRALALYIRAGMRPYWPYFALRREKSAHEWRWATDMDFIVC